MLLPVSLFWSNKTSLKLLYTQTIARMGGAGGSGDGLPMVRRVSL